MSDAEKAPGEPAPPPSGLGVLFLTAAFALALVLALVALIAYMALAPPKTVNPPARPATAPLHEGQLFDGTASRDRRT